MESKEWRNERNGVFFVLRGIECYRSRAERTAASKVTVSWIDHPVLCLLWFIIISIILIMLNFFCTTIFAIFSNRDVTVICLFSLFRQNFDYDGRRLSYGLGNRASTFRSFMIYYNFHNQSKYYFLHFILIYIPVSVIS